MIWNTVLVPFELLDNAFAGFVTLFILTVVAVWAWNKIF